MKLRPARTNYTSDRSGIIRYTTCDILYSIGPPEVYSSRYHSPRSFKVTGDHVVLHGDIWYYDFLLTPDSNCKWVSILHHFRPYPRLSVHPVPVANIEQVRTAKLLGVVLCDSMLFDFGEHVHAVLKTCNPRMYLMKLLRDQGLPSKELYCIVYFML